MLNSSRNAAITLVFAMPTDAPDLPSRIRQILLADWDPQDAARLPEASETYDTYIPAIIELLGANADEETFVEYFYARERESMCFPGLGKARLRPLARNLLALRKVLALPAKPAQP
jgi:hypothetical protein